MKSDTRLGNQDPQSGMAAFAALRARGEWIDAVRMMLDRAADSPDAVKLDLFTAMAEVFQSDFPSKGVDTELQRIQISRLLTDAIAGLGDPASAATAKLLIALSRKAGDNDRIIEFGRFLAQHFPEHRNEADQVVGQALFNKRRHDEALAILTSVPPKERNKSTLQILERLKTADSIGKAKDLFAAAFAIADTGTDPQAAREALGRATATALPALRADALSHTLDVLAGTATAPGTAKGEADRNLPIFCGGFRWSGASAVYDFLADQSSVAEFWRRPRFMQDSPSSFEELANAFGGDRAAIAAAGRVFLLDHVIGVPKNSSAKALKTLEGALLRQIEPGADLEAVDASLAAFYHALDKQAHLAPEARRFPGPLFASALRAFAALANPQGRRFVLFDSVIRGSRADLLGHLPGAKMVVVERDPRDMYVTHVERGNWTHGVERYIEELKELRAEFERALGDPAIAKVCRAVRFEAFVTDEAVRGDLLAWLGIDAGGRGGWRRWFSWLRTGNAGIDRLIAGRFVPEQSAQNIGVYRHFKDQAAITALEESFPELCVDIAPRMTGTPSATASSVTTAPALAAAADTSGTIKVVTFSPMATRRQQLDQMGLAGKPGEPGWARRREITVNLLAAGAYDFIGLQHCYLDRKPPYNAVGYFQDRLAERGLRYGIINHVDTPNETVGDSTPLYYRLDRWELDPNDHGIVWFKTPPPSSGAPGGGGRLFIHGLFHERASSGKRTGRRLYVYNTRLRDKHTDELDLYRARCIVELTEHIDERAARGIPAIVLADTNTKVVDSLADRVLRGEEVTAQGETLRPRRRMTDALIALHPGLHGKTRTQHNFKRPGDTAGKERNDRVMFDGALDVVSSEIVTYNEDGLFPSYHYPVNAVFAFPDPSRKQVKASSTDTTAEHSPAAGDPATLSTAATLSGLAADQIRLRTAVLEGGNANLGCFLHEVVAPHSDTVVARFVEKRTTKQSEIEFVRHSNRIAFDNGTTVGPRTYDVVPEADYHKIYMEYVEGRSLRGIVKPGFVPEVDESGIEELMRALSLIASYDGQIGEIPNTAPKSLVSSASEAARETDTPAAVKQELIDSLEDAAAIVSRAAQRLPHFPCHNDIFWGNLLISNRPDGTVGVRVLDWGQSALNYAGAELHHFISSSFGRKEMRPLAETVTQKYADMLRAQGYDLSRDDVYLGGVAFAWVRSLGRFRRKRNARTLERTLVLGNELRHLSRTGRFA